MAHDAQRRQTNSIRRKLVLGAGGAAVAAASPFGINIVHAQNKAPIKIGFPVPLTGPFGTEANEQVKCAEIAIKEFNAGDGLNGRMAELLVRDDKLNPGEAATRTLELIEKEKVNFVVGSLSAAVQLSVNNVTKERGVIFNSISQSDAIGEVKDFSKYTFHEALNPHMTSGALARYVIPKFGKRVVFFVPDYAYGHEMLRGFQRAGKEFGMETLADLRYPLGTSDYSSFFPRVQALKPDMLVHVQFRPRSRQRHQAGVRLRHQTADQDRHDAPAAQRAPGRRSGAVRGRGGRHLVLLENRGFAGEREAFQRPLPQGLQRRRADRLRRARLRGRAHAC